MYNNITIELNPLLSEEYITNYNYKKGIIKEKKIQKKRYISGQACIAVSQFSQSMDQTGILIVHNNQNPRSIHTLAKLWYGDIPQLIDYIHVTNSKLLKTIFMILWFFQKVENVNLVSIVQKVHMNQSHVKVDTIVPEKEISTILDPVRPVSIVLVGRVSLILEVSMEMCVHKGNTVWNGQKFLKIVR